MLNLKVSFCKMDVNCFWFAEEGDVRLLLLKKAKKGYVQILSIIDILLMK